MEQRLILINLLIKLGVAASVASILVRSVEFKSLLFRENRARKQRIYLVLWIGIPIALGVWIRLLVKSFFAGDLSFETTMLLGVVACPSICSAEPSPGSCAALRPIARIFGRFRPSSI
jgi:two-component system LytT family sensor kinase